MLTVIFGDESKARTWWAEITNRFAALDGDAAVRDLAEAIARDVDPYAFGIFLEDAKTHELVLKHRFAHGPLRDHPVSVHSEQGMVGFVYRHGVPLVVHDVASDPRYLRGPLANARSAVAVPIRSKGLVVGVLDIESDRAWAFDNVDIEAMESLAAALGTALARPHRAVATPVP